MQDEQAASSTATETPESSAPVEDNISTFSQEKTAEKPEVEESDTSEETESQDESEHASEAAKQERPEGEHSKAERRIKQLTAQLKAMERRMQQGPIQSQPRIMPAPQRPQLDQFDDIGQYNSALEKYEGEFKAYAIQQDRIQQHQAYAQRQQQQQVEELRANWAKRSERVMKSNPDFDVTAVLQRVEPSPTMDGFFADSEVGPELLDYFDGNPDEADKIRAMSPFAAVRELVRLEDKFSAQVKGIRNQKPIPRPPGSSNGQASAPARPRTAADIFYK
jgi:hypothetical protein